jgi:uncharacterized protein YukE
MTSPTSGELEDMAKILLRRADDLHAVGTTLSSRARSASWQCDKADRFRSAIAARQTESHRLAVQLRDLGRYLRLLSQQAAQQPAPPGS